MPRPSRSRAGRKTSTSPARRAPGGSRAGAGRTGRTRATRANRPGRPAGEMRPPPPRLARSRGGRPPVG
ncbi:MAG TPA: hypothetical protein EYQ24_07285 [Bacteroidetes bacterium]|nr:hypothetical protein [Bacteroidota bacterium]HIL56757.1 hypothetical protein [Rhodothermales bacterium]